VNGGPEERNPERGDADIGEAQQQKRVAGVAEAEEEDDGHGLVESRWEL
jgi:hypothetical protein